MICTLDLPAGIYVVTAFQAWSDTTREGYREIAIRKGQYYNSELIVCENSNDNGVVTQYQSVCDVLKLSTPSPITMWARQGSGTNLSVEATASLKALRIR